MQDRLVWDWCKKETALFVVDELQQQNTTSGSAPGSQEQESKAPLGTGSQTVQMETGKRPDDCFWSCFSECEPTVASDSCSWHTGAMTDRRVT